MARSIFLFFYQHEELNIQTKNMISFPSLIWHVNISSFCGGCGTLTRIKSSSLPLSLIELQAYSKYVFFDINKSHNEKNKSIFQSITLFVSLYHRCAITMPLYFHGAAIQWHFTNND